jgi:TonB family protein
MQVIANLQRLPRISAGVLNVEALNLSTPEYPAAARAINAGGSVSVFVTIDENGNVVSAEAVSGHPLLRDSAQKSAKSTTFAPTMLSGQRVKVNGLIIYNYETDSDGGNVTVTTVNVAIQTADSKPVAAEMLREWMIKQKLHSWVYALVERLRIGSNTVGPNDGRFVSNGSANLRVTTVKVTPELKTRLASLGFEILAEKGVILTGRIAVSKLAQLGDMDEIKLILPDA